MKLAFCDDQIFFVDKISTQVNSYLSKRNIMCICDKFTCAKELILACNDTLYDAIFLDVEMPTQNGITIAAQIQKILPSCLFIFVSAHMEYALEGYHVNALRYILKSQAETTLPNCLDTLMEKINNKEDMITLYIDGKDTNRKLSDILYFEGAQHYVIVNTVKGKNAKVLASARLTELEQQLKCRGFLRIQKSLLVNAQYIVSIKNYTATLYNGEELKTSEANYAALRKEYLLWKGDNI